MRVHCHVWFQNIKMVMAKALNKASRWDIIQWLRRLCPSFIYSLWFPAVFLFFRSACLFLYHIRSINDVCVLFCSCEAPSWINKALLLVSPPNSKITPADAPCLRPHKKKKRNHVMISRCLCRHIRPLWIALGLCLGRSRQTRLKDTVGREKARY